MSRIAGGIPRYRPFGGPALLQEGFRPFFLGAALWSALALCLWLGQLAGHLALPTGFDPLAWHAHEMIFGFAAAAVSGFLLTAIPNWTGRMPLQGVPLAMLAVAWLAGRAALACSALIGAVPAAMIDLSFLLLLLLAVFREIAVGRNWRNLPMPAALTLLILANLLIHLEAVGMASTAALGQRLAIAVLLMLIAIVGGRIIPSFTRNWLAKRAGERLPATFGSIDKAALATNLAGLALWVSDLASSIAGVLLVAAGVASALRLARWRGHRTLAEPLLWVLHLGHGWLALGLVLLGLSELSSVLPQTTALHALTAGAIGTMILAVMTRATLGHTGRALAAGSGTTVIYLLVTLAAVSRIAADFADAFYMPLLVVSGIAWVGAFLLFVMFYGCMLTTSRERGGKNA